VAPRGFLAALLLVPLTVFNAHGQQITGAPGSPDATTTIDGRYLPNPLPQFRGEINPNALQSKPYWPARVVPPQGAPNVLLIMTDDTGFGAGSTFGGVIPMPTLDRLASMGLRYTNMNSTALCSPSRAALITGRNHHTAGFGVVSEQATGFPGRGQEPATAPMLGIRRRVFVTLLGSAAAATSHHLRLHHAHFKPNFPAIGNLDGDIDVRRGGKHP
jgi:arylsulfatase